MVSPFVCYGDGQTRRPKAIYRLPSDAAKLQFL